MSDREIERWSAEGSMIGDSGTIYGPWSDGTPRAKYTRTWVKYEDHCNIVKDLKRAIMTAKAEAYEDAAKICDPIHTDSRMTDHEKHAFDLRDVLSQAIRSKANCISKAKHLR